MLPCKCYPSPGSVCGRGCNSPAGPITPPVPSPVHNAAGLPERLAPIPALSVVVDDIVTALVPFFGPTVDDWKAAEVEMRETAGLARTALQRTIATSIADRIGMLRTRARVQAFRL
jgi:hypothetical protein